MDDANKIGGTLSIQAFFQWAAAIFKSPRGFFGGMERKGGYLTPCLYVAGWSFLSSLAGFLVGFVRPVPGGAGRGLQAAGIFLSPVVGVLFAFLAAAILFVIWHLMGSKENFETSFRCWALMAPAGALASLLGVAPMLPLLAFAYTVYLVVLASQEVHGIGAKRSWVVWGILGGGSLALMMLMVVAGLVVQSRSRMGGDRPPFQLQDRMDR